jgi:undecaprenyl-diphosphatase
MTATPITPIPVDRPSDASARAGTPSMIWPVLAILGIAGFIALTVALAMGTVFPFDRPLLDFAKAWAGPRIIWDAVSQSANFPLIFLGVGFVVWLMWHRRWREAILAILVLAAVTAGSEGVKELTARQRPAGNGDGIPGVVYSYPSGHILECFTILGMITLRFWRTTRHRRLAVLLVVLVVIEVVLVGIARVALQEHFPTDLIGGLLGGIAALSLYAWFTRPGGWADRPPLETRSA